VSVENGKRKVDADKVLGRVCLIVVTVAKVAHLVWTLSRG
jgi:hypothetical protein